ncbi:hypothetical protein NDU88_004239 [Pleurodeles waltl]|uniref:Uncharacterized protein n=1 Tax=Pleurodeles waltl TaxID=8319 RepID=A0AAV7M5T6_PLEWA|nr:hypothetical protein NDU88_004239 [Pleurodeles waltl]
MGGAASRGRGGSLHVFPTVEVLWAEKRNQGYAQISKGFGGSVDLLLPLILLKITPATLPSSSPGTGVDAPVKSTVRFCFSVVLLFFLVFMGVSFLYWIFQPMLLLLLLNSFSQP